jgi:MFS family permease
MYLPTAIPFALAIFFAGNLTSWLGYYTPVMVAGTILLSVGGGLITTFSRSTPPAQWIIYQAIFGTGAGLLFQQSYTAIQTVLPEQHVATALVVLSFTQELGAIVGLAISQNIFLTRLTSRLVDVVPGLDPREILDHGTVGLPSVVPEEFRNVVYQAYNETIVDVFYVGLVAACATICAIGIEWRSVKEEKKEGHERDAES